MNPGENQAYQLKAALLTNKIIMIRKKGGVMGKIASIIGTILIFSILMLASCQTKTVTATVTTTLPASTITSTVTVTNTTGSAAVYTTTTTIFQQTTVTRTVTPTTSK
jgi:hypothetical protein